MSNIKLAIIVSVALLATALISTGGYFGYQKWFKSETDQSNLIDNPSTTPDRNYAVYNAVLSNKLQHYDGSSTIVISEITGVNGKVGITLQEKFTELKLDTISSYNNENINETTLLRNLNFGNEYILLSKGEQEAYLSGDGGMWEDFYQQHPTAQGITTLSAVGFSNDGNQALVDILTISGFDVCDGTLILLEKANGGWTIVGSTLSLIC